MNRIDMQNTRKTKVRVIDYRYYNVVHLFMLGATLSTLRVESRIDQTKSLKMLFKDLSTIALTHVHK